MGAVCCWLGSFFMAWSQPTALPIPCCSAGLPGEGLVIPSPPTGLGVAELDGTGRGSVVSPPQPAGVGEQTHLRRGVCTCLCWSCTGGPSWPQNLPRWACRALGSPGCPACVDLVPVGVSGADGTLLPVSTADLWGPGSPAFLWGPAECPETPRSQATPSTLAGRPHLGVLPAWDHSSAHLQGCWDRVPVIMACLL